MISQAIEAGYFLGPFLLSIRWSPLGHHLTMNTFGHTYLTTFWFITDPEHSLEEGWNTASRRMLRDEGKGNGTESADNRKALQLSLLGAMSPYKIPPLGSPSFVLGMCQWISAQEEVSLLLFLCRTHPLGVLSGLSGHWGFCGPRHSLPSWSLLDSPSLATIRVSFRFERELVFPHFLVACQGLCP